LYRVNDDDEQVGDDMHGDHDFVYHLTAQWLGKSQ
jgi:hypothetical protein